LGGRTPGLALLARAAIVETVNANAKEALHTTTTQGHLYMLKLIAGPS
jgi:hypothetical protein